MTAEQPRGVVDRLSTTGQQHAGDPDILVLMDSGYDVVRLAWLLRDAPVVLVARRRSNRVFPAPAGTRRGPTKGRAPRHGDKLVLQDPGTHPVPAFASTHVLDRYGTVEAVAFGRMHPKIDSRGGFKDHEGALALVEGTVLGVRVEYLPGNTTPQPRWLWSSQPIPGNGREMDHGWSMSLRRFDLEHTFEVPEAASGMDPAPPARAGSRGPVDLDRGGRPPVVAPGPTPGR